MDFKDSILQLSERIAKQREVVQTEEATKNAFIMPLIAALGYDVFNPSEVVPEMDCDINKKKGEKIDYAIMLDGNPILLIECKHWAQDLNLHDTQLQRYFVASKARFGVLTNGIEYRFYTDLEKSNIMDVKPFLVVNLLDITDAEIEQLKKFHKSYYNEEDVLSTANELKYTTELKSLLTAEFQNPSTEFVRYFAKQVYTTGQVTSRVIELFTALLKKSISSIINERISDRLNTAIKTEEESAAATNTTEQPQPDTPSNVVVDYGNGIITTEEEIESYRIVKAILRPYVDVSRIYYRDAINYFSILLDDNNRKPLCRMYFNAQSVKYIGLIGANKASVKHEIKSLDDIYNFADELRATLEGYLK
jgi:hypothetical protein